MDKSQLKELVQHFIGLYTARNPGAVLEVGEITPESIVIYEGTMRTKLSFEYTPEKPIKCYADILPALSGWARPRD